MHDEEVDENEWDESHGKVPGDDSVDNDRTDAGKPIIHETFEGVSKKLFFARTWEKGKNIYLNLFQKFIEEHDS